jgi:hypothetical protein
VQQTNRKLPLLLLLQKALNIWLPLLLLPTASEMSKQNKTNQTNNQAPSLIG